MKKFIEWLRKAWNWVGQDGLLSFSVSALLVVALGWIRPLWIPAIIVLILGLLKEVFDGYTDKMAEWHDVICDTAGVIIGLVLVIILTGF